MIETRNRTAEINPYTFEEPAAWRSIGNTPLLPLRRFASLAGLPDEIELWLKAEWTNPGGSVKDRPAREIVRAAFARGQLGNGKTLLDSTSGNTGIAYAMLGAACGFPVELVVPENCSEERKVILRAYGATVTYSDPLEGSDGAAELTKQIAEQFPERYFFADQYSNPANVIAHLKTTGPEIWRQTDGRVTHFLAGLGTTGTMTGVGSFLKGENPDIQLAGVQPDESFHGLEGLKHLKTNSVPSIFRPSLLDDTIEVSTEMAYDTARKMAREEGLFVGISAGAAIAAALVAGQALAARNETGLLVALAPDGGSRYLSTTLWNGSQPT